MLSVNSMPRTGISDVGESRVREVEEVAYVSRKLNKIRWKCVDSLEQGPWLFLTGSSHGLDLWNWCGSDFAVPARSHAEFAPEILSSYSTGSDVTEMRFFREKNLMAYCTDKGSIGVVSVDVKDNGGSLNEVSIREQFSWSSSGPVSCSSLDVYDNSIVVTSRDGRLQLTDCMVSDSATSISGDTPISTVKYISRDVIATGSPLGSITLWDPRTVRGAVESFAVCRMQRVGATCLTSFPTESHILVCGGRNGTVSVFDTRGRPVPLKVFDTTPDPVAEMSFHATRKPVLFTLSNRGALWMWSDFLRTVDPERGLDRRSNQSPTVRCLLNNDRLHSNSLDTCQDRLVVATDNEAIVSLSSLHLD